MATAFAVYSADDNSLNFYKRDTVPTAGDNFNGKIATAVYTGIETDSYIWDNNANAATTPWYSYHSSITSVSFVDNGIKPVSTAHWFEDMTSLTAISNLNKLDTSSVTNMYSMFNSCAALTSLDLSHFDTSNVTNMCYMFKSNALTSLDLSSFNTSNVMDMSNMFLDCSALSNIYVSDTWSVANVTRSSSMFSGCSKLPNFDSANTGKSLAYTGAGGYLTCAGFMNNGSGHSYTDGTCTICGKAQAGAFAVYSTDDTSLNFYKRSTVPTVGSTFNGKTATAVYEGIETSVYDKSPWNSYCSSVTSVSVVDSGIAPVSTAWWFYNMNNASLTTIGGLDKLDTSNVTDMSGMFYNCNMLTSLDLSSFNTSNVTNMANMFYGCSKLTSLDVGHFDTANVTYMYSMFYGCSALTSLDVSGFDTANVTNMNSMFSNCSKLTSLDVSNFNTAKVTNMQSMFYHCSSLTSLDLSNFDTANVTRISSMFSSCKALTSLDVSGFDTANVTDMANMFVDCSKLTSLDVSSFDTANVTNMQSMFYYCSALTSLDVSHFDTANVTYMANMFYGCYSLSTIYVGDKWSTAKVTSSSNMFYGCTKLPNYNGSVVDKTKAHYNSGGYLSYISAADKVKVILEKGAVDIIVNKISTIPNTTETWTLTLSDGSTVTKAVYIK